MKRQRRIAETDLTQLEGPPSGRADPQIDPQQVGFSVQALGIHIRAGAPDGSTSGTAINILMIVFSGALAAAVFAVLGHHIKAPPLGVLVTSALAFVFIFVPSFYYLVIQPAHRAGEPDAPAGAGDTTSSAHRSP
jgi:hypothetical protein